MGILVLFLGTIWVLMVTVSEDGLPTGGAKVAVVEIEGVIVDG
ncbi:MAG: Signal peptide peptidase SppA, partial [Candidatus Rokubacteria bacterium]|nr:Signal peptide peptidase SppA [Candidatus Rokubacteria bacterium]